ncbi:histone acetyltransferase 1 [Allomyces javanicus]|nr:histone acetyltransferase 1 [Allomyces javanicus]
MSSDALVDTTARATQGWLYDTNAMVKIELLRRLTVPDPKSNSNSDNGEEDEQSNGDIGDQDPPACSFHPVYTYPFYGTDQQIAGYRNPRVVIRSSAASLVTHVAATYDAKSHEATLDLVQPLLEFLPSDLIHDDVAFAKALANDAKFTPPGNVVLEYETDNGAQFQLFECIASTPGFPTLYDRLKIFAMYFIEAATPVDVTDPAWTFYLLYQRHPSSSPSFAHLPFEFAGLFSTYSFYLFPDRTRRRISQVLILPPFQRQGHAARIYAHLHRTAMADAQIGELAVEDPSEAFDVLRDVSDLRLFLHGPVPGRPDSDRGLAAVPEVDVADGTTADSEHTVAWDPLAARSAPNLVWGRKHDILQLCTHPVKQARVRGLRAFAKLQPRQAERVYEMLVLNEAVPAGSRRAPPAAFRRMVKARIYRAHKDALEAVADDEQRKELVHETYLQVLDEYLGHLRLARRAGAA